MSLSYRKIQSVSKVMVPRGPALDAKVLETLKICADLVGSTLGPGGMSVVIERQEPGLPPIVTKDGVTVFKALGFESSVAQVLMEATRAASVRTASEAGDGTTTATILAEAFVRFGQKLVQAHPHIPSQRVARTMEVLNRKVLVPRIRELAIQCSLASETGRSILWDVARVSANGDAELADAVMECFDIVGDEGNVTITEDSGPSSYKVEKIEGYPVGIGLEDCCGIWFQEFINDAATQQASLEDPLFLLYYGRINDFNDLFPVLGMVAQSLDGTNLKPNVVVCATGFADNVLANMAAAFKQAGTLRVFPLLAPKTASKTGQYDFMLDLAALTGTKIFDPLNAPLQNINSIEELGRGPRGFQAARYRSTVLGFRDELLVLERVDELTKQLESGATSEYERTFIKERVAKLTSGIARLIVTGPSNSETKEKRDRAEDAVCAVRGALKDGNGALPGGGSVLLELSRTLAANSLLMRQFSETERLVAREVMAPALLAPAYRLFFNMGWTDDEALEAFKDISPTGSVLDLSTYTKVDARTGGLYDSTPAVLEAIQNSISVAGLLSACGGVIAHPRDAELERTEARSTADFLRASNYNEANDRP